MALIKCKECGREISSKSAACPGCGAPVKAKTNFAAGCLALVGIVVLIGIFSSVSQKHPSTSPGGSPRPSATPTEYKVGDTIAVGYTGYKVVDVRWSDRLTDNPFLKTRANANYLVIKLGVANGDKQARMIPPFHLVDENGAEYDASSQSVYLSDAFPLLENLNPGVGKAGSIAFDVPRGHTYKLKLSGGYWSRDYAFVELNPGP